MPKQSNTSIYLSPELRARVEKLTDRLGVGVGKLLELLLLGMSDTEIVAIAQQSKLKHLELKKAARLERSKVLDLVRNLTPAQIKKLEAEAGK